MYLSQLTLNPWARAVIDDLNNPYQLHRSVMSAFPAQLAADERVLFRLDLQKDPPQARLLVQSRGCPDWSGLAARDYLLSPAQIKVFEPQFQAGDVFIFRLSANPTKRLGKSSAQPGSRVGLLHEEEQQRWLERKGAMGGGFHLLDVRMEKIVQPDGIKSVEGKRTFIRQHGVRFDGRLAVDDAQQFAQTLADGIGSGKGLGFGLLSLKRCG